MQGQAQTLISEIREQRTVSDADGNSYPIRNHGIDAAEGCFLSEFITNRPNITRTLEIGCAYGFSSLHIAGAIAGRNGARHMILDPFQSTDWKRIGVTNLDRADIDFYELREEPSELALPNLVREGAQFDLVFIDGWHTFDHTIIDLYYANRLVMAGGYIIVDDATMPSVSKAISYFANYPCYKIIGGASGGAMQFQNTLAKVFRPVAETVFPRWMYDYFYRGARYPSMVAFQKIADDQRNWNWFRSF